MKAPWGMRRLPGLFLTASLATAYCLRIITEIISDCIKIPQDIPLYIGSTAKKLLKILTEKLDFIPKEEAKGLPRIESIKSYFPGQKLEAFGDIHVTPFIVDHSALDSYMFFIETGGKKILFTGDFREHGIIGENNTLEKMVRTYIGEIDILITEGTMLSRVDETKRNPYGIGVGKVCAGAVSGK